MLGGTGWLGGEAADQAVAAGHDVTCAARGSGVAAGARHARVDRDDDTALTGLARERWDAVVDVARDPEHVRRAVRDLGPRSDRYLLVSTASVYASQSELGADEDAPRLDPLPSGSVARPEDYGAAKVACEDAVLDALGTRSVVVRPGLIGGPGDTTGRTGWWPWRFARPAGRATGDNRVLVPDAPDLPTAVLDVRDLAAWLLHLLGAGTTGVFDAAGQTLPLPQHLAAARDAARAAGGPAAHAAAAPQEWLTEHGVAAWAGLRSLPLWLPGRDLYGMSARSGARALAAGLRRRPLAQTLHDTLAWELGLPGHPHGAGLTDADERDLLAALDR
ncbi:nucleoside-diphosphate-sugar epimerase [Luteimicrobium subarcticum]|uniref:Nucleoside-diphosphate-sugar epimerase n=1 Tax=Luteimicrobium subarcticum TaxID=620910 RepID=A0A2M8WV85_9MICO|nr:nucleoside-diphosphate-sugar epimerase [Luteimicrobium subarcticum]